MLGQETAPASTVNPETTLSAKVEPAVERTGAAVAEIRNLAQGSTALSVDNLRSNRMLRNGATVSPRRIARTDQKLAARRAMAGRWRAAERATEQEAGNRLLGVREAWRRWAADPAER